MVRKVGTARIVREIGRGGMGVVYEAIQEGLERPVAVKALDQKLVRSREQLERFRREGRVYARLRHESIVAVHDLVEKDEQLFLITEFVDGADLARVLAKGGALPPDCVAVIGARVADALDYVHFNSMLHRDVKPANVMLSRDGEVKLMDFGIAKGEDDPALTRAGMLVGSPSYMAPEVLNGEEAGPSSEVWALGVTLYELLTGEKPFRGANSDDLFAVIRRGRFPRIRSLAPACPWRLARAVEKCLSRRTSRRFKSAGALARALNACAARALRKIHPRARLVALLAHRGFATEEVALEHVDGETLAATRRADEKGTATLVEFPVRHRSHRLVLAAAVAVVTALAIWFAPPW
ncbi:MAG TPA: serine/threonine-protein kinase [Anaeromyxobacter sp.]|nr:serine/threonine-protein kinase [Anaeromyxobacter sp.]